MRSRFRRLAKVALLGAIVAAPLAFAPPASAGTANITTPAGAPLTSGTQTTDFRLQIPAGSECSGDTATDGYLVQAYFVPASVNPATLTWSAGGPNVAPPPSGINSGFMYSAAGVAYDNEATLPNAGSPRPRPGPVGSLPVFDWATYAGGINPGAYNIGIMCTTPGPTAVDGANFWNTQITFDAANNWTFGAAPVNPVVTTVTAGNAQLTAAFTHAASTPASNYHATAAPVVADTDCTGGSVSTTPGPSTAPIVITGLVNDCTYDVTVTANNGVPPAATSSAVQGTPTEPAKQPVTNLTATPGTGEVELTWTEPGDSPDDYLIEVDPVDGSGSPITIPAPASSYTVTGLNAGTLYTFTVTPLHDVGTDGTSASTTATPFGSSLLFQNLTVTRPVGALVLTQVCGAYGPLDAEAIQKGFPDGLGDMDPVDSSTVAAPTAGGEDPETDGGNGVIPGTSTANPAFGDPTGTPDPVAGDYPYPTNASLVPDPTYPTNCGLELGIAEFVTEGAGSGQYFAAQGRLNQVTVVDTRDDDTGWVVNGDMTDFYANNGTDSFSGSQVGWTPHMTEDTGPFTDSLGNTYDQTVVEGPDVNAGDLASATGTLANGPFASASPSGSLTNGAVLAYTPAPTGLGSARGLGTAILDARVKLLIPVTADSGNYEATLSITAI